MSNSQGTGEDLRRLMEESSQIMVSTDKISEKERRLLVLGIRFVAGDGGVIWWNSGTPGVKPGHQVSWPKPGRTGVSTACLQRVCETGKSIAPPDAMGRIWAEESPNGHGRVVVLPLRDGDCVVGAIGFHLNRALVPCEAAAGVLRSIANLVIALRGRELPGSGAPGEEPRMVGDGRAMSDLRATIMSCAEFDATVLVTGETGSGKELVARSIHGQSGRRGAPFVALNCAAVPEHLLESELFGHEQGAFTGAARRHKGKIERAEGGTLFLDEIGDMALPLQAKLLRFLQEREFERVGGEVTLRADVRVIAATNSDLRDKVRRGEFREDLYYRLCVEQVAVPPLRDRREDIPALVAEAVRRLAMRLQRDLSVTPEAVQLLARHDWPGNVRELENCVCAALAAGRGVADATTVAKSLSCTRPGNPAGESVPPPGSVASPAPRTSEANPPASPPAVSLHAAPRKESAREAVLRVACEALKAAQFRICAAAKLIGRTRQWLRKFIIKHKLDELLGFKLVRRKPAEAH